MNALRFALYAIAALIVVDGDTVKAPYGVTYRLLGFDAPETHFAKCDAELELGLAAKQRLEELVATSEVKVIESGKLDKYGRSLAHADRQWPRCRGHPDRRRAGAALSRRAAQELVQGGIRERLVESPAGFCPNSRAAPPAGRVPQF